jgi:Histidine kinase-, DNA gyrase B-, and HSP90-like ATPase
MIRTLCSISGCLTFTTTAFGSRPGSSCQSFSRNTRSALSDGFVDAIEVEVTDTGPGLSPEALSEAKEPFAQLSDSSTRRYRGLGLGLAVVQQSIDALGGQMVLRSHVGSGSKFLVTIPIRVRENSVRASMARHAQLPMIPQGSTSQEPSDALLPDEFSQRARS